MQSSRAFSGLAGGFNTPVKGKSRGLRRDIALETQTNLNWFECRVNFPKLVQQRKMQSKPRNEPLASTIARQV
jgi:hypothetical protein